MAPILLEQQAVNRAVPKVMEYLKEKIKEAAPPLEDDVKINLKDLQE